MLDGFEVVRHNHKESCWLVIDAKAYDVTEYLNQHPGGLSVLLELGGRDATAEFRKVHSLDVLQHLPRNSCLGPVDPTTLASLTRQSGPSLSSSSPKTPTTHISQCISVTDFEAAAKEVMPRKAYIYIASSSNSGLSMQNNLSSWSLLTFRPRILRDVANVSSKTFIVGYESAMPFFVAPMGVLGRAHLNAEVELVRSLPKRGIHAVISTESTKTAEEIAEAHVEALLKGQQSTSPSSQIHFQLYLPVDRAKGVKRIQRARRAGYKSLWVTVDCPVMGKRTADRRARAAEALGVGLEREAEMAGLGGGGPVVAGALTASLKWEDLEWIREAWDGPIVLKGIQCADDAKLAMEHGCQGIVLSNHGGRQIHSAPDALTTLLEIRRYHPSVLKNMEVLVDGGLRDGADVLKAICLGASAVGVGRPFLYALAAYGARGVERCIDILAEELHTTMRLLGITSLDQARPEMINTSHLLNRIWRPEKSHL